MKFKLSFLAFVLFFAACKEIPPIIPECQTQRVVLIEEFTGVQCVNCPTGSEKINQLLNQHGAKLIAVSVHTGFFSIPYNNSVEDFTTVKGGELDAMLGPVTGYPAAVINRKVFEDESQRTLSVASWAGYIERELCREPMLNLKTTVNYDEDSRKATISVNINPRISEILSENVGITLMITEDGVISPQATLGGKEENYIHKHILRTTLTAYNGKNIYQIDEVPDSHQERFSVTLEPHWKPENCHVIALVHYQGQENMEVIQASQESLWQ